jgi:RNA polymerase sigma-70 factor (ECF subfamily)
VIHHSPSASGEALCEHPDDMSPLVAHLDAAYNLARWLMRDENEAEDVVQDSYLRAISHFSRFWGGDGRAWMLTIVRNVCYDRLKRNWTRDRCIDFDGAIHSGEQQTSDAEDALLLAERSELLEKSLAELPEEYREILVLRELEQLSYREISLIANIQLGTVMSRLSRARRRLQQTVLANKEGEGIQITVGQKPRNK